MQSTKELQANQLLCFPCIGWCPQPRNKSFEVWHEETKDRLRVFRDLQKARQESGGFHLLGSG